MHEYGRIASYTLDTDTLLGATDIYSSLSRFLPTLRMDGSYVSTCMVCLMEHDLLIPTTPSTEVGQTLVSF